MSRSPLSLSTAVAPEAATGVAHCVYQSAPTELWHVSQSMRIQSDVRRTLHVWGGLVLDSLCYLILGLNTSSGQTTRAKHSRPRLTMMDGMNDTSAIIQSFASAESSRSWKYCST